MGEQADSQECISGKGINEHESPGTQQALLMCLNAWEPLRGREPQSIGCTEGESGRNPVVSQG